MGNLELFQGYVITRKNGEEETTFLAQTFDEDNTINFWTRNPKAVQLFPKKEFAAYVQKVTGGIVQEFFISLKDVT